MSNFGWRAPYSHGRKESIHNLDSAFLALKGGKSLCPNLDLALLLREEGAYPKLGWRPVLQGGRSLTHNLECALFLKEEGACPTIWIAPCS